MNKQTAIIEAIVRTGSFVGASQTLEISQPAVSKAVRTIEQTYGIKLFERNSHPLKMTPECAYYLQTEEAIRRIEQERMQHFAELHDPTTGLVRIGTNQCRTAILLGEVISEFSRTYPRIKFKLLEPGLPRLPELLEAQEVDLCLTMEGKLTERMDAKVLISEEPLLVVPPGNPFSISDQTTPYPQARFEDFANEKFIVMDRGQQFYEYFRQLCITHRVEPAVILETKSIMTVLDLVKRGVGCAVLPDSITMLAKPSDGLTFYSLSHEFKQNRPVLAWKRGAELRPCVKLFVQEMLEHFKSMRPHI